MLAGLGLVFEVRPTDVDETPRAEEPPAVYVRRLAEAKAEASRRPGTDGELILAADTIVALHGELLGKPRDAEDAKRLLGRLSGREHEVLTGVAVVQGATCLAEVDVTRVRFAELTAREIDWYVATGEPLDKAGAYAVQGLAAFFVEALAGNHSNVVGLPLPVVYRLLRRAGYPLLAELERAATSA